MKSTLRILSFSKPYIFLVVLNSLLNLLSALFSLFSISLIIPILGLLFGTIEPTNDLSNDLSFNNLKDFVYNRVYELILNSGHVLTLGIICLFAIMCTIFKNSFRYLALYTLTPIRNNIIRDIRKKLFNQILKLQIPFFNKFKKGDLISRATNDLIEIEWSIMGVLELFIKDPITILIFLSTLFYMNFKLTLISLIFIPITALIISSISKSLKQKSKLSQFKFASIVSLLEDYFTNIKLIKSLKENNFILSKFTDHNESLKNINNKVLWRKDLASPLSEMLSTIVLVIIIWIGGNIVLNENFDAESFIGYLLVFSQILPPAKSLTSAFYSIQKGAAAADRIFEILLSNKTEQTGLKNIKKFKTISFKNVSVKYKDDYLLEDINFNIESNKRTAIVGESGSGKTTLVELLLKHHSITSGEIKIDNNCISEINTKSLISVVTQDILIFNDTIFNNVIMTNPKSKIDDVKKVCKQVGISSMIDSLSEKYETIIGSGGINLSGGEKQKISLARALLSENPILILDEPTSALDSDSDKVIFDQIKKLNTKKTVITITHKLKSVIDFNNTIVLSEGKLISQGNHNFLSKNCSEYKKLCDIKKINK